MVMRLNRMAGFETRTEYYTGQSLFSTLIEGSQLIMHKVNAAGIGFVFLPNLNCNGIKMNKWSYLEHQIGLI